MRSAPRFLLKIASRGKLAELVYDARGRVYTLLFTVAGW